MAAEYLARSKALAVVLSKAKVVDGKGDSVDLSAFTATAGVGDADDHEGHDHA